MIPKGSKPFFSSLLVVGRPVLLLGALSCLLQLSPASPLKVLVAGDGNEGLALSGRSLVRLHWGSEGRHVSTERIELSLRSQEDGAAFRRDGFSAVALHPTEVAVVAWFGVRQDGSVDRFLTLLDSRTTVLMQAPLTVFDLVTVGPDTLYACAAGEKNSGLLHQLSGDGRVVNSFHRAEPPPDPARLLGSARLVSDGSSLFFTVVGTDTVFEYDLAGSLRHTYGPTELSPSGLEVSIKSAFAGPEGGHVHISVGQRIPDGSGGSVMLNPTRRLLNLRHGAIRELAIELDPQFVIHGITADNRLVVESVAAATRGQLSVETWVP